MSFDVQIGVLTTVVCEASILALVESGQQSLTRLMARFIVRSPVFYLIWLFIKWLNPKFPSWRHASMN